MKKKNKIQINEYLELVNSLDDLKKERLDNYFKELKYHFDLSHDEKNKIKEDFENAILYLTNKGVSLDEALNRLDLINLGGFYARPSTAWFNLDDVAKMFPQFMMKDSMEVFRLSAYLKEDISKEILQIALMFTIKRFPSFAVSLKRGFFWHYLDSVKKRFEVLEDSSIPCMPINVSLSGSHTFRVLFYKNRISVEFFHGMTDGTGGMEFLKALVKEYLVLLGKKIPKDDRVFDINEMPNEKEFENSFEKLKMNGKKGGLFKKKALQLSGKLSTLKPCRVLHFKMDTLSLKEACKKYNSTVTAFIASLLFIASKRSIEEMSGDIVICIPVNLRKYFDSETIRNFSLFSSIRLDIGSINKVETNIDKITEELKKNTSKENMIDMMSSTVGLTQKMSLIPLFLKQPIVKFMYNFIGDNQFTTSLSNLGVIDLPKEMSDEILSLDFVLGTAITNRFVSSLVTINNVSTLSLSKLTVDPGVEEELYRLLTLEGVKVEVEGSDCYGN